MKILKLIILVCIALLMFACQKQNAPTTNINDTPEYGTRKMSDLLISKDFKWNTTKDIDVEVKLPLDNLDDILTIKDIEDDKVYFKGYRENNSDVLSSIITIPSYIDNLKLIYGDGELYPELVVSTTNYLSADFSVYGSERSICGCDDGVRSLSLIYNGNTSALIIVKEENTGIELFNSTLNAGDGFTFSGSGSDGKMDEMISLYIDGTYDTSITTDCSTDLFASSVYGSFYISSGITDNFVPLCYQSTGNPVNMGYTGTLAYEDLWPSEGDYDFNDLVITYDFDITKNTNEEIIKIEASFTLYAMGASFYNGFGFELPSVLPNQISSVNGYTLKNNSIITLASNGVEANQSKATIIAYDDCFDLMLHPGVGTGINTETWTPYVQPVTINLEINFIENGIIPPGGTVSFQQLNIGHFNPFIIVNQERGKEIHLPGYKLTDLGNSNYLGQWDDDSNIPLGRYYVTKNNYPWAIAIPEVFDYPIERIDINNAYNYFKEWAESDGEMYKDWYKNKPNYKNNEFIFNKPTI